MLSLKKNKSSNSKSAKRNFIATIALLVIVVVSIVAWLSWSADQTTSTNTVAIIHDNTTQPQAFETVKVGDEYELQATSQPIDFIATTDGDVYCKTGENEMRKISISKEEIEQLTKETRASIEKVKLTDPAAISVDGGEVLMARDGDSLSTVVVNPAEESESFNDAVSRIKSFCRKNGKEIAPADLPEFTFTSQGQGAATVLTSAIFDTSAESNQLFGINLSRYSKGIPTLTRTACLDTVARTWTVKMADANVLSHNPNWWGQIATKCRIPAGTFNGGENVGYGPSSQAIFDAFKKSPGHWSNILSRKYNRVGIGGYVRPGTSRLFITQNFANF